MEPWSQKHRACRNCGTTRRRHVARGYCNCCYFLVRISGIYLEHQLRRLARLAGARHRNVLFGFAGFIADAFNPEQRHALYALLLRIEESVPWRGIDLTGIYRRDR